MPLRWFCVATVFTAVLLPSRPLAGLEPVKIAVDVNAVVYTMRGGWGASWHAIEEPIPYGKDFTHGGSAWGGNPPAEDERAWQPIYGYADWLGFDWCRVEVEQRMYQPLRNRFDWDNPEMRILYRILDWCQSRGADVFFQQMWGNVDWNTFPPWRDDPIRRVHSGPISIDDYAEGLATLVEYLIKKKGYTCIRWVSINNEPGHGWSWWQKPGSGGRPVVPMSITPGLAAVRKALDRRRLSVPLAGPDWTDMPPLEPEKIDFDQSIGAYDVHSYWANFDGHQGGYPLSAAEERLADWANWAHARGKPLFLSEQGSMAFGWGNADPNPSSYPALIKDTELVARGLRARVDGFNRWSFINRGDLDGQWQMIDTWDRNQKKLLPRFSPHANSYFMYGLVSRFTAKHSSVLACTVEGGRVGEYERLFAGCLRSPSGNLTLLVVNEAENDWQGTLTFGGLKAPIRLHRYRITPQQRDRNDLVINADAEFELASHAAELSDRIPGFSVAVYTTYQLSHDQPGVISD